MEKEIKRRNAGPSRKQAMAAFCHECQGYYVDGKIDCENKKCPLYYWMPYRKLEPDFSWKKLNSKRKGKERKVESR